MTFAAILGSKEARASMWKVGKYLLLFGGIGVAILIFVLWAKKSKMFKNLGSVGKLLGKTVTVPIEVAAKAIEGAAVVGKAAEGAGIGFAAMAKGLGRKLSGKKTDWKAKAIELGLPAFMDSHKEINLYLMLKNQPVLMKSPMYAKKLSKLQTKNPEFYNFLVKEGLMSAKRAVRRNAKVVGRSIGVAVNDVKKFDVGMAGRLELVKPLFRKIIKKPIVRPDMLMGRTFRRKQQRVIIRPEEKERRRREALRMHTGGAGRVVM